MRFSVAAIGALAAGAVAQSQSFTTDIIYETETYCPEESATAAPAYTPTYSVPVAPSSAAVVTPSAIPSSAPQVVTEVVTSYVTYCPAATTFTYGTETISVTEPTTLTLTNGPYTVTRQLLTSTTTYCNSCPSPTVPAIGVGPTAPVGAGPTAPAGTAPAGFPASSYIPSVSRVYPHTKVIVPSPKTTVANAESTSTSPSAPVFTGAASRAAAGAGAGLAGVFALAAYLL